MELIEKQTIQTNLGIEQLISITQKQPLRSVKHCKRTKLTIKGN